MLRRCETVAFAHAQGVIHRDLKPGTVMIGRSAEVLVFDWGVAKVLSSVRPSQPKALDGQSMRATANSLDGEGTRHGGVHGTGDGTLHGAIHSTGNGTLHGAIHGTGNGTVVGTPGYMSPEQQAGGSAHVDETADVFALGVMLAALLEQTAESRDRRTVPQALRAVIARACAAQPANRYRSALQLADDIRRWMDGQAVTAYRERTFERVFRFYQPHQTAVLLVATCLVVRTVILFWRHV